MDGTGTVFGLHLGAAFVAEVNRFAHFTQIRPLMMSTTRTVNGAGPLRRLYLCAAFVAEPVFYSRLQEGR